MSTRSFRGIRIIRFGDFELDVRAAELRKHGIRIRLQEQPFRILVMLLEHPGEVVLREEIRRRLWPNDTVVEVGHGINAAVLRLREALSESAGNPRYVETLARRGYRFTGPVEIVFKDLSDVARKRPAAAVLDDQSPDLATGDLAGRTFSHYRVLEQLGVGGMGVVYRAQDLTLGRHVALKFLPQDLAGDPVALGRFQREARAASSLNHPAICTIYGVEECGGQPVIVMELVEGETLEACLAAGPIPFDKALPLAIQMAGALDAAHRKGIVHRDLKPANVLVTQSGVKVLDFGLAKIQHPAVRHAAAGNPFQPGESHVTQEGEIIGTLHYMSPEQVQGKDAGAGSDIFSFGVVLYEMLAGKRAFAGDNPARVMAAILTAELPEMPGPAVIEPVLRRCLAKDPEDRWQSARDLKAALEWIAAGWRPATALRSPEQASPPMPMPPSHDPAAERPEPAVFRPVLPVRRIYWIAGAFVAVALAALFLATTVPDKGMPLSRHDDTPFSPLGAVSAASLPVTPVSARQVTRFTVSSPDGNPITRPSLSPDGRRIAFRAGGQLYVRTLDSLESHVLPEGRGNGSPFWSADGRFVAVVSGGKLRAIDLGSGTASTLWDINTTLAGAWGPDGNILIGAIGDGIFRVHAATRVANRLTSVDPDRNESRHLLPQFLPDGRHFLFVAGSPAVGASTLYAGSLDSDQRTAIMAVRSNVSFVRLRPESPQGYLVFARDRILMAQPFDSAKLKVTGEASPIGGPVVSVPALGASVSVSDFSVAGNTLAYRSNMPRNDGMVSALLMKEAGDVTVVQNWMAGLKR
ncbi:MAG TPA: protein kinase [Bryobacteraceae bacterium]